MPLDFLRVALRLEIAHDGNYFIGHALSAIFDAGDPGFRFFIDETNLLTREQGNKQMD